MSYQRFLPVDRPGRARLAAALTTLIGLIALTGWLFDIPLLRSVLPGAVDMKANTAFGLVFSGAALLMLVDRATPGLVRLAQALSLAVALLGLATLGEYAFGWQLGIDERLFRDTADPYSPAPGRMSPHSAAAFAAIGLALAIPPLAGWRRVAQLAAALVLLIGAVSFLGYVWNAYQLVSDQVLPPVALNAALAFVLLGGGALLANRAPAAGPAGRMAALAGVETRIMAGFIVAFSLLLVGGAYTYRAGAEFSDASHWVAHTQRVRAALGQFTASVSEAESAQRDYLLTGDQAHRQEYLRLARGVSSELLDLGGLVSDNPGQLRNLEQLRAFARERLDILAQVVDLYEKRGLQAARQRISEGKGIRAMQAIHDLARRMDAAEAELLAQREADSARVQQRTLVSLLLTLLVAAGVFAYLFRSIRREMVGRAEAEHALRASEQYNRSIVESSPDCLALLSREARLSYMAPQGRRLMEVDDAVAIDNADWLALWRGDDLACARSAVETACAGSPGRFQGYCPTFKGTPKWWDVIVMPIAGPHGQPERLLAVARDISELKLAEAKLLETNRFLDSLVENIPNMIFVKDAANLRFVRFNKAGEQLIGYSREDLIGRNDRDFFSPDEADFFISKDREVLSGGELVDIPEEPIHTRHQGVRTLHTMKLPILDEQGQPQYLLGISEDISERKQAEQAIRSLNSELQRKAVQLEATNKELESFTYSVSHDLRAPLRAIDGFALMLEEDCAAQLDGEGKRYLSVVRGNSKRMGVLIDDLLAFSRLGRQAVSASEVDMSALVREVVEEALPHGEAGSSRPEVRLGPLPPAHADRALLRQVWVNLISNAIKYSGKTLAPSIEISGKVNGAELVYSVRDNGVGFSMDYYDKLFGVFQRLHRADEFAGTGVGLAIVHRVVTRHGGRVWAEGKVDAGATFSFSLPNGEPYG